MGEKAVIGAAACCILGLITYYSYGQSRVQPILTPWRTVRTELMNPEQYEREKRWLVFHTAAAKQSHPDYLDESEFVQAMGIIAPDHDSDYVRKLFREIELNNDGVVDVDEFLLGIQDDFEERE